MLAIIQKHWKAILGGAGIVYSVVSRLLDAFGYYDTLKEHGPAMLHWLVNPPGWLLLLVVLAGLALIWWDVKRTPGHSATVQLRGVEASAEAGKFTASTAPLERPILSFDPDDNFIDGDLTRHFKIAVKNTTPVHLEECQLFVRTTFPNGSHEKRVRSRR